MASLYSIPTMSWPNAGELNKRVQIRLRQDVPVGLSSVVEQHSQLLERWARLSPVGTAVWAASVQTDNRITHRAIIRYMDGITENHEIVHRQCVYRVRRSADLRSARKFLVLDLEELGATS